MEKISSPKIYTNKEKQTNIETNKTFWNKMQRHMQHRKTGTRKLDLLWTIFWATKSASMQRNDKKKTPQRVQEGGRQGRYRSRRCKDVSTTPLLFPSHLLSRSLSLCVLQWEIRACWEELLAFLSEDKACSGLVQLNPSSALSMVLNQLEGLQLLFYSLSLSLSKPPSTPSVSFWSQYSSSNIIFDWIWWNL